MSTSKFFDKIDNGKAFFKFVFEACSSDGHVVCKTAEEVRVWLDSVFMMQKFYESRVKIDFSAIQDSITEQMGFIGSTVIL